jgi:hypothetical protein
MYRMMCFGTKMLINYTFDYVKTDLYAKIHSYLTNGIIVPLPLIHR